MNNIVLLLTDNYRNNMNNQFLVIILQDMKRKQILQTAFIKILFCKYAFHEILRKYIICPPPKDYP